MEKTLLYENSLLIILPRSTYEKEKDALLKVPPIQRKIVLDLLRKGKSVNYCLTAAPMVYNCFMMNYYITYQELIDIFGR